MGKIFEIRAIMQNGKWMRRVKRLTFFTEKTVPAMHEWLKCESDAEASYFLYQNEKPIPPIPPNIELPEIYLTAEQQTIVKASEKRGCGCGSKKKTAPADSRIKTPTDDCWICAEKHLGSAYDTYAKEHGYQELNRLHYIGALNDAENHLAGVVPEFAEELRAFRHDIQNGVPKNDSVWQSLCKKFYDLKDSTFAADLFSKKFNKIYLFSNVATTEKISPAENDLLVFLNKAVNAEKYIDHPHKICFHRSNKPEYGKRRFDMPNAYVFGQNGIPDSVIRQIKADYDWNYKVEEGKVKSCTTGYMVALHLAKCFPDAELVLVNFGLDVLNSTYRCPWHNWQFEDEALKKFEHIQY